MHPLVREFCYQLLADKPAKHQWAAEYYIQQCGNIGDPDFATDAQVVCLLAAWSHFVKADDHKSAADMIETLRPPLMNRGQYEQVMQLLEMTTPPDPIDADYFVIHKARILSMRGQTDAAVEMLQPLLNVPNKRTVREAVPLLLRYTTRAINMFEAIEVLHKNRLLFMGSVAKRLKSRFLLNTIHAHLEMGDSGQALQWATQLCQSSEVSGDKISGAVALREMAASYEAQGKFSTAPPNAGNWR